MKALPLPLGLQINTKMNGQLLDSIPARVLGIAVADLADLNDGHSNGCGNVGKVRGVERLAYPVECIGNLFCHGANIRKRNI